MDVGIEGETVGFVGSMGEVDRAVRMMTAMLNRFNHADIYIGVHPDGSLVGIDIPDDAEQLVFQKISEKVNHPPKVTVSIVSEDGRRCVHIHAEGFETPYSFGSWFYVRRYRYTDDKRIEWVENLTCGMKWHRFGKDSITIQKSG